MLERGAVRTMSESIVFGMCWTLFGRVQVREAQPAFEVQVGDGYPRVSARPVRGDA